MVCPAPPLSIRHEGSTQFPTPVDFRLLLDCCPPAVFLYKMGDLSFTSTPSRSDLSVTSGDEESDSSSPRKMLRKATVKTTDAASLSAPLPPREAIPLPWYSWREVPQWPPASDCRNSLSLWYDTSDCSPSSHPISGLKGWWKPSQSTWDKMPLTSHGFPVPQLNTPLSRRQMMSWPRFTLL